MRGIFVEKIGNLTIYDVGNAHIVVRSHKRTDYTVCKDTLAGCRDFIARHPYGITIAEAEAMAL